jgi:hypothetical protein
LVDAGNPHIVGHKNKESGVSQSEGIQSEGHGAVAGQNFNSDKVHSFPPY